MGNVEEITLISKRESDGCIVRSKISIWVSPDTNFPQAVMRLKNAFRRSLWGLVNTSLALPDSSTLP